MSNTRDILSKINESISRMENIINETSLLEPERLYRFAMKGARDAANKFFYENYNKNDTEKVDNSLVVIRDNNEFYAKEFANHIKEKYSDAFKPHEQDGILAWTTSFHILREAISHGNKDYDEYEKMGPYAEIIGLEKFKDILAKFDIEVEIISR